KNPTIDNNYIYLTESDRYWYDRQYKEIEITCNGCMETKKIIGAKNIHLFQNNEYCSEECREAAKTEYYQEYISENDHVGLSRYKDDEVTGYIYKITNKRNMKCYVGQTIKPALFRWWQHLKIEKKFEQVDISDLVFEVLEVVTYNINADKLYANAKDKLNKREAFYISLFDSVEEGYNEVQPKEFEHDLFTINN
ncbi:MAG TPA: GIY-YIG nuclease family protein, partial [Candidatus Paenibacillus intestinavium]|nr:GIY-YIG nuclease family protein [Candidatus Paenibacillus intestinavium]